MEEGREKCIGHSAYVEIFVTRVTKSRILPSRRRKGLLFDTGGRGRRPPRASLREAPKRGRLFFRAGRASDSKKRAVLGGARKLAGTFLFPTSLAKGMNEL